ncbi:MAG: hypothetical protein NTW69_01275 [Chloroflexi bacterium]|jgi:membrane protein YdbS with pleckstrin-like domain|nr:hypothetical protein [Chloroflexota bacterium]
MKQDEIKVPYISYLAAFVIGVISFASIWKAWFGSASSAVILVGMAGVAFAISLFWLYKKSKNKEL